MTKDIEEFKGEAQKNELIATDVAKEVQDKLKLAIQCIEARA
jgi:hypothetical protein